MSQPRVEGFTYTRAHSKNPVLETPECLLTTMLTGRFLEGNEIDCFPLVAATKFYFPVTLNKGEETKTNHLPRPV